MPKIIRRPLRDFFLGDTLPAYDERFDDLGNPITEAGGIIGGVQDRDRRLLQRLGPRPAKSRCQDPRQIPTRRLRITLPKGKAASFRLPCWNPEI